MTKEQAIALYESKFWEKLSSYEIAEFQLQEELVCMPFGIFHGAVQQSLGRPVFTHEFTDFKSLLAELRREKPPRSMAEIIALIPTEKVIIVEGESAE